jgi:uridine kinase
MIGIAGPSCAGKTALARHLARRLRGESAALVSLDSYYRDLSALDSTARVRVNFDHPDALEKELLVDQLRRIARGETVEIPVYDFRAHTRSRRRKTIRPGEVVLVEGLFALYWVEVRELLDLKIFLDVEEGICLRRRVERDARERGRTARSARERYLSVVRPMYERHAGPTIRFADLVLDGAEPVERLGETVWNRVRNDRSSP